MKNNEEFLRLIGDIDDRFVEEAGKRGKREARPLPVRIGALAACLAILFSTALYLFLPMNDSSLSAYRGSEYYDVIASLDGLYEAGRRVYKNRFDKLMHSVSDSFNTGGTFAPDYEIEEDMIFGPSNDDPGVTEDGGNSYNETTDNQVEGVIEADLFKRSDTHVFYLDGWKLYAYSLAGEDSEKVGELALSMPEGSLWSLGAPEMFLSSDAKVLTVIYPFVNSGKKYEIAIRTIDVSDPTRITELGERLYRGSYVSSRVTDGKLLLISRFAPSSVDYGDPATFIPSFVEGGEEKLLSPDEIVIPEHTVRDVYTVITLIDEQTGAHRGSTALLSYSDAVYVSQDSVYVTSPRGTLPTDGDVIFSSMTDITRVDYSGEQPVKAVTYSVGGSVLDQYSMDEYNGVFRVVTSANDSASLFCLDKASGELLDAALNFAPRGEEVTAARFDRESAYVCTAVRITFTDPVFFFDLSDPSNITYTDTGYIDGFSTSLINYGDGLALGIGEGDVGKAKVEVYAEVEGSVISISEYTVDGEVSDVYKAYYVDRELGLFGFGARIQDGDDGLCYRYVLLKLERGVLVEIASIDLNAHPDVMRATVVDGYLYAMGRDSFAAEDISEHLN